MERRAFMLGLPWVAALGAVLPGCRRNSTVSPEYQRLYDFFKSKGVDKMLSPAEFNRFTRLMFEKGWRRNLLVSLEDKFLRAASLLPRVDEAVVYVVKPQDMSLVNFVMQADFENKSQAQHFRINLAGTVEVDQEHIGRLVDHEILHALEADFLIGKYQEDCYLYQGGRYRFDLRILSDHRLDYVQEIIEGQKLTTPLSPEQFRQGVQKYRKTMLGQHLSETIDSALAEVVVWAYGDLSNFRDLALINIKMFIKTFTGNDELSKTAVWRVLMAQHPMHAAFYALLLEKYGWSEYAGWIKELFARPDCPRRNKEEFEELLKILQTQWMAAEGAKSVLRLATRPL